MKKIFTLAALAAMTLAASAGTYEGRTFDVSAFSSEGGVTAAGTTLGSTTNVSAATGTDESGVGYKTTSTKMDLSYAIAFYQEGASEPDVLVMTNTGLTGTNNPKVNGSNLAALYDGTTGNCPDSGCTFDFKPTQSGTLYVVGKFTGSKLSASGYAFAAGDDQFSDIEVVRQTPGDAAAGTSAVQEKSIMLLKDYNIQTEAVEVTPKYNIPTAISTVAAEATANNAKVVAVQKNGQITIGNYNIAGQRVK